MKHLKTIFAFMLISAFSIGQVWAAVTSPITLTTSKTNVGYSSGTQECTNAFDYKLTFSSVTGGGANYVQNAKNSSIYNTIAIPGNITSIKLTDCATTSSKTDGSFTIYGGTSVDDCTHSMGEITGLSSTAADKTVNFSGDYNFFKIVVGSARVLKISSIVISFSSTGGQQEPTVFLTPFFGAFWVILDYRIQNHGIYTFSIYRYG